MEEKERPGEDSEQEEQNPKIRVKVTIHGSSLEIEMDSGSTLGDLIEELKKRGLIKDEHGFMVMLDGRTIGFDPKTGRLTENPILAENATLSLLKEIKGGNSF